MLNHACLRGLIVFGIPWIALAQSGPDLQRILNRLDQLEDQNRKLLEEIQSLRRELSETRQNPAPQAETTEERLEVQEHRTEELAQTKVEASQKMPLSLTGMLLFNTFDNGAFGGASQDPVTASTTRSPALDGASFQQTVLGLKFNGPDLPGGGKASGTLYMDFFGAAGYFSDIRLRTATLDLTWRNTTLTIGQDKPIFAPREPDSLAQVGVSPLTGAGNLWDWQPQIRLEQRFSFSENTGLRAQAGVYQTSEQEAYVPAAYTSSLSSARPALEGRFELWHGQQRRFEIAPGFHVSETHVAGVSVPSRVASLDGLFKPASWIQFTGAWFNGENVANMGGLRDSLTILSPRYVIPVHAAGGWGQIAIFPTQRLSFHFYGGEQSNRQSDLYGGEIHDNFMYAANVMYRLAPNILASFEASQVRTSYINQGIRLNNHYDLAMAYLF